MAISCSICCEETKSLLQCLYCQDKACKPCTSRYLLSVPQPKCMFCSKDWTIDFLETGFTRKWLDTEYKEHRKKLAVEREEALLPHTPPRRIEEAIASKRRRDRINEIDNELRSLVKQRTTCIRPLTLYRNAQNVPNQFGWTFTGRFEDEPPQIRQYFEDLSQKLIAMRKEKEDLVGEENRLPTQLVGEKRKHEPTMTVRHCPANECRGFLDSENRCSICQTQVCGQCLMIQKFNHSCKLEDIESVRLLSKEAKPCPGCGTSISKVSGCDQMWCPACKTAFSWNTGEIDKGPIHNPHYYHWRLQNQNQNPVHNPHPEECINFDILSRIPRVQEFPEITEVYRVGIDIEYRRRLLNVPFTETLNEKIRIRYLIKEIDRSTYENEIFLEERRRLTNLEVCQVLEMFRDASSDILRAVIQRNEILSDDIEAIRNLIEYTNEIMHRIEKRNKIRVLYIDNFDMTYHNGVKRRYIQLFNGNFSEFKKKNLPKEASLPFQKRTIEEMAKSRTRDLNMRNLEQVYYFHCENMKAEAQAKGIPNPMVHNLTRRSDIENLLKENGFYVG